MSNVLIIGARREVVTQKYNSFSYVLSDIRLVSRENDKSDIIAKEVGSWKVQAPQLAAEYVPQLVKLMNAYQLDLVIHIKLLYQDRCKEKSSAAFLGSGFDLGVTSLVTAMIPNFISEIHSKENTQEERYWENVNWIETKAHEIHRDLTYPCMGIERSYLIYHGELDFLTNNYPSLIRTRCWMTFGEEYLTPMKVVHRTGMGRIYISIRKHLKIIPLQFLRKGLPEPAGPGEDYGMEPSGECSYIELKDKQNKFYLTRKDHIHHIAFEETRTQEVFYTTTAPAMVGAERLLSREGDEEAVHNAEEISADFFSPFLATNGFPSQEEVYGNLEEN